MECAVVSSKGQITIPLEVMQKLGISKGDKVFFISKNGRIIIKPENYNPLKALQITMKGEAERIGWKTEDDVNDFCKEIRKKIAEEEKLNLNANND